MLLSPWLLSAFKRRIRLAATPLTRLALALSCLATARLPAQQEDPAFQTLYSTAPDTWRGEIIPFPLEFAPDIELSGREELRFAPGMFDPKKGDFFSYTFVWWLDGKVAVDQKMLRDNLLRYYKGLYRARAKTNQKDLSSTQVEVTATRDLAWVPGAEQNFRARIEWVDPFVTQKPLTLHMMIAQWYCEDLDHTAVYFAVSPNQEAPDLWETMKGMRAGRCQ